MTMTGLEADTQAAYRNFATREAHGNSPLYEQVCQLIAQDADLLAQIGALPAAKRQPNLVLGAARYLGAPESSADAFVGFVRERWDALVPCVVARMTQTNEVGRCATLLPFIAEFAARFDGPIAVVEVGCSAGLALYPDLYAYRYRAPESTLDRSSSPGDHVIGGADGAPELVCAVTDDETWQSIVSTGSAPHIAWRGGLDLKPLDVTSDTDEARDTAHWLDALVWPGQDDRRLRLGAAIAVVREAVANVGAPAVVAGDVVDDLDALLELVPDDLPLVLVHSAVLAYTDPATRSAFEARMGDLAKRPAGFTWISNEAASVMPGVVERLSRAVGDGAAAWEGPGSRGSARGREGGGIDVAGRFVLAVDGTPRALTGPHGQTLGAVTCA